MGGCLSAWTNGALPSSSFAGPTAFGFWDDLYIYSGTSQTVYYGTTGTFPNRNLVFEFYTAHFSSSTRYYRFQIVYYENAPGIVRFFYFQCSDAGASATIGTQGNVEYILRDVDDDVVHCSFVFTIGSGSGPAATYAVNVAGSVPVGSATTTSPTLTLTFNTNSNTYTSSG